MVNGMTAERRTRTWVFHFCWWLAAAAICAALSQRARLHQVLENWQLDRAVREFQAAARQYNIVVARTLDPLVARHVSVHDAEVALNGGQPLNWQQNFVPYAYAELPENAIPGNPGCEVELYAKADKLDRWDLVYTSGAPGITLWPWPHYLIDMVPLGLLVAGGVGWVVCLVWSLGQPKHRRRMVRWSLSAMVISIGALISMFDGISPSAVFSIVVVALLAVAANAVVYWHSGRDRRPPIGICARCGYNLRGNESGRCPECGTDTPEHQHQLRRAQINQAAANLGDPRAQS